MSMFEEAAAWDVATGTILSAGDYVLEVKKAEAGQSSGGYFQIELECGNDDGHIRDWLVVTQNAVGKVAQLADAAGIARPTDGEFDANPGGLAPGSVSISSAWIDRLVGKKLGVVIREVEDYNDPTKTRTRVQGYVTPEKVREVEGATAAASLDRTGGRDFSQPSLADEDIPF